MKKKLKKDDYVLILNVTENFKNRTCFSANIDKINSVNSDRIKLKKNANEDFDTDGNHATNGTRKLHKLQPKFVQHLVTSLRGDLDKIKSVTIDKSFLTALIKENDDEQ